MSNFRGRRISENIGGPMYLARMGFGVPKPFPVLFVIHVFLTASSVACKREFVIVQLNYTARALFGKSE